LRSCMSPPVGNPDLLQLDIAHPNPADIRAHGGKVRRCPRLRLDLKYRAADEIDAEVQADEEVETDRQNREYSRGWETHAPEAHEIELGIVRDETQHRDGGMQTHGLSLKRSQAVVGAPTGPTRRPSAS